MKYTFVILLLVGCYGKKVKPTSGFEGKAMPAIDLIAPDSLSHFNTKEIPTGKPTILISFEPWCPYCRAQTKSIVKNIEELKDINFIFICNSPYSNFKKYYDEYHLSRYANIKAGIDTNYTFDDYFQSTKIPFFAIYGRDKKLKQILVGKNYISTIKEVTLD
ncbi:MAG: redoxin family protein [Chitinophagaceae bacterium]